MRREYIEGDFHLCLNKKHACIPTSDVVTELTSKKPRRGACVMALLVASASRRVVKRDPINTATAAQTRLGAANKQHQSTPGSMECPASQHVLPQRAHDEVAVRR